MGVRVSPSAHHPKKLHQQKPQNPIHPMSQHRSLRSKAATMAKRNVLKRIERIDLMKKRGQWKEGQPVIGLPKTKPE
ncbi:MAG: small basic protein [Methylacidiphilales bacterium]|nr:small basic protein [Candidatus Methylacidiphilales bacterium]